MKQDVHFLHSSHSAVTTAPVMAVFGTACPWDNMGSRFLTAQVRSVELSNRRMHLSSMPLAVDSSHWHMWIVDRSLNSIDDDERHLSSSYSNVSSQRVSIDKRAEQNRVDRLD